MTKAGHMDSMPNGAAPTLPPKEEAVMALACTLYEQGAPAESFRLLACPHQESGRLRCCITRRFVWNRPDSGNELSPASKRPCPASRLEKKSRRKPPVRRTPCTFCKSDSANRRSTAFPCERKRLSICLTTHGSASCGCLSTFAHSRGTGHVCGAWRPRCAASVSPTWKTPCVKQRKRGYDDGYHADLERVSERRGS